MTNEPLRIIRLEAENYKRLKAVAVEPDGNVVVVGGRNAQGKSSLLDAIFAALGGRAGTTQRPINEGATEAKVTLDLGKYIVTRKWKEDGPGTLTITSPEGAKYASPQAILDDVIGAHAFDPLAFTRLSARDQKAALLATVDLPFDPDELERERKGVFERRTEINREVAKLEGQIAGYPLPDQSLPDAEVSAADVLAEEDAARAHNARIDAEIDVLSTLQSDKENAAQRVTDAEAALRKARAEFEAATIAYEDRWDAVQAMPERIDTSAIRERLQTVEQTNARIRQEQQRKAIAAELSNRKNDAAAYTIKLRQIEKDKADALAQVAFPVDGLGFDDTGVLFRGLPFTQASAAEQLRVSVGIAMAANPTLRVLRILDGSLLDDDSMRIIADMAAENDYQIWVEVVGNPDGAAVVIEDGMVEP